jgi:vitamin-K-epoxide reductase (warfarin-sensitive)
VCRMGSLNKQAAHFLAIRTGIEWLLAQEGLVGFLGMRYLISLLALAGVIVASLALHVHYSTETEPCSINAQWDCGIVNHSPYAVIGPVPVAAIGIAGYAAMLILAFFRRKRMVLAAALIALGFSLYLTHIEKDVLLVWCVYCVTSLGIISLITLASLGWQFTGRRAA